MQYIYAVTSGSPSILAVQGVLIHFMGLVYIGSNIFVNDANRPFCYHRKLLHKKSRGYLDIQLKIALITYHDQNDLQRRVMDLLLLYLKRYSCNNKCNLCRYDDVRSSRRNEICECVME